MDEKDPNINEENKKPEENKKNFLEDGIKISSFSSLNPVLFDDDKDKNKDFETLEKSLRNDDEETFDVHNIENKKENVKKVAKTKNGRRETETEKQKKKKRKQKKKDERNKKYPSKISFLIGLVVLIFALIGVFLTAWNSINYIKKTTDTETEFTRYNEYLKPLAAVDPDPFDDISRADQKDLLNIAIWKILDNESTPDAYSYQGGYLIIPSEDVRKSYASFFGSDSASSLQFETVEGYNCTFEYDSSQDVYKIPVTTIQPVYTARVTDVKEDGSRLSITADFLLSDAWRQDGEGGFIAPEPDKVVKVTLTESAGAYYVTSIQTVSSTIPEIVSFEEVVENAKEPTTETETQAATEPVTETTTAPKAPEVTTLGGRLRY